MKNNFFCKIKYDGKNFRGWAKQPNQRTIEFEIEKVLSTILNQNIKVFCSGRTDAEVHANGQTMNFFAQTNIEPKKIKMAFNSLISRDIKMISIKKVHEKFNARFNAIKKEYFYLINTNKEFDIFKRDYVYQYNKKININKLRDIAKYFIGEKNFSSFSTSEVEDKVRKVEKIKINNNDGIIKISITGNGFLRYMVRMIIGTFLAFNESKINKDFIDECFREPRKGKAIYKAPGCGLYLNKVYYEDVK